ncbi:hypothetical protein JL101_029415 (plasmid) [Skermanella rosea]|uniref:hypothetical protein n=1 Tax=Skermanella rosea TaxID=1817965 RepID=UPI001E4C2C6E|nr:hypothetical protein [Skermanella rosea]UEM07119.1 hypothetical protein JL101_029415 [Skermanella rosea]
MPQIIQHIDRIARQKQRDVLMIVFGIDDNINEEFIDYYETDIWSSITAWLDEQKFLWVPCAGFALENSMDSCSGQIYVDIPYDEQNADYRKLKEYFEKPDGTMRMLGVSLRYLPLSVAMRSCPKVGRKLSGGVIS